MKTATTTAYLEVRSQSPKGRWPKQGPDTYVAIQYVPDDVAPLTYLNRSAAKRRGIVIEYVGEGYRNRTGPTSSLGQAMAEARERVREHNGE